MKSPRILAAALLLCSFAACGQTPTGSDRQAQPAGASFDGGGFGMGAGRNTQEPDTTTMQDMGGQEDDAPTPAPSEQDAERGGFVIGSGN